MDLAEDRKGVISLKCAAHITNGMALIRYNGASIIIRLLFISKDERNYGSLYRITVTKTTTEKFYRESRVIHSNPNSKFM